MIQDIAPHRFDRTYSLTPAGASDFALCFGEDDMVLRQEGEAPFYNEESTLASLLRLLLKFQKTLDLRVLSTGNNFHHNSSHSLSHNAQQASLGIRQSPRGDKEILPTFGPSGRQERLNC